MSTGRIARRLTYEDALRAEAIVERAPETITNDWLRALPDEDALLVFNYALDLDDGLQQGAHVKKLEEAQYLWGRARVAIYFVRMIHEHIERVAELFASPARGSA